MCIRDSRTTDQEKLVYKNQTSSVTSILGFRGFCHKENGVCILKALLQILQRCTTSQKLQAVSSQFAQGQVSEPIYYVQMLQEDIFINSFLVTRDTFLDARTHLFLANGPHARVILLFILLVHLPSDLCILITL